MSARDDACLHDHPPRRDRRSRHDRSIGALGRRAVVQPEAWPRSPRGRTAGRCTARAGAPLPPAPAATPTQEAELWAFDGKSRAPSCRIRHGEELRLTLENETALPLSLHFHGVRGPERHGRGRRPDPGAGRAGQELRVPLHPARCRHLPDPPLRARRQRRARWSAASRAS